MLTWMIFAPGWLLLTLTAIGYYSTITEPTPLSELPEEPRKSLKATTRTVMILSILLAGGYYFALWDGVDNYGWQLNIERDQKSSHDP